MADPVEAAIKAALLGRLVAFCASPAIPLSLPNVAFPPPTAAYGVYWLRATLLPADSEALSVGYEGGIQHTGLMQVDVFYGQDSGELAPTRVAATVAELFRRGTEIVRDGFTVTIHNAPSVRRAIKDEPWLMVPVIVPYQCFAPNPA